MFRPIPKYCSSSLAFSRNVVADYLFFIVLRKPKTLTLSIKFSKYVLSTCRASVSVQCSCYINGLARII
jgi:hypothetical protein